MLIDTHAHIYLDRFSQDLPAGLARARDHGGAPIVMATNDEQSNNKDLALFERVVKRLAEDGE